MKENKFNLIEKLKVKKDSDRKEPFLNKRMKNGSYSVAIIALVITIAVVANLVISTIPTSKTTFDFSDTQLLTLSDQTKSLLKNLKGDVTIYLVAQKGNEDKTIKQLLDRYKALSPHIKIEYKDPVLYPNFTSQYDNASLTENSIVVVSGKRYKTIDNSAIYVSTSDYTTYQQSTSFDGEGQLTSAIDYVTSENLPVIYTLSGHKEAAMSTNLENAITKDNMEVKSLDLITEASVPQNATCLLILAPQSDISSAEKDKILDYLNKGGNAYIVSNYSDTAMPYLAQVLYAYGVQTVKGIVVEGDSNYYANPYSNYLLPTIDSHESTASLVSGKMHVLIPNAQGITKVDKASDTLTITPLLTTSDKAFSKVNVKNASAEKEKDDINGPFDLAVAVTNTINDKTKSNLIYVTSQALFDDSLDTAVSGGNSEFIRNTLGWLCQHESSIAIHAKSMDSEKLVVTAAQISTVSGFFVIIVPVGIIIIGFVVWLRRRKR